MSVYYDTGGLNDFNNGILTDRQVTYPFAWPNNAGVKETIVTIDQYEASVPARAYGSASNISGVAGVLTGKGPLTQLGGAVVRYTLTYTETPQTWNEKQIISYTFPGLSGINANGNWNPYTFRSPITLYCIANVSHQFSQGLNPPTPDAPFLVTDHNNAVDYIGTSSPNGVGVTNPAVEPTPYIVGGSVNVIRPTLWENVTISVNRPI